MSNGNTLQAFLSVFVPTGDGVTASPGLISGGGTAAVTQTATASESVLIQPGTWVVPGPSPTTQGAILWTPGTSQQTVGPFTAANATNPRIDLITVHVNSAGDATTAPDVQYSIVTGTAAASPSAPPVPTGDVFVRQVLRSVGDTSIVNARITGSPTTARVRGDTTGVAAPGRTSPKVYYGTGSGTTDASGYLTWTHGIGTTPAAVSIEGFSPISGASNNAFQHMTDTYTSTTVRTRFANASGGVGAVAVTFRWIAYV